MDYQEAIEYMRKESHKQIVNSEEQDAYIITISAMQELQEYKQLGTLEEMKMLKATHFSGIELAQISCKLKQLEEYVKIGTLEEVREAVEKQRAKKATNIMGDKLKFCTCPSCEKRITNVKGGNYCQNCGQKLDWGEEKND